MSKDADKHFTTEADKHLNSEPEREEPVFTCGGVSLVGGRPQYGDVRLAVAASHDDLARRLDALARSIGRGDLIHFAIALATGKLTDEQLATQLAPPFMREVRAKADEIVKAGSRDAVMPASHGEAQRSREDGDTDKRRPVPEFGGETVLGGNPKINPPLVRLGQGDYARDIHPEDL